MFDAGQVIICQLIDTADPGCMPVYMLEPITTAYFGERTVGYNRYYAAQGVNEQVDLLIRVWRDNQIRIGMYALLYMSENDGQYRITNVQHLLNDDGLKVTDLTLSRVEDNYVVTD